MYHESSRIYYVLEYMTVNKQHKVVDFLELTFNQERDNKQNNVKQ